MRQVGDEELLEELGAGVGQQAFDAVGEKVDDGLFFGDADGFGSFGRGLEFEPEEGVGCERQRVGLRGDGGEGDVAEHLDGDHAGKAGEVERDGLGEAGEVGDAEDGFADTVFFVLADVGQNFSVVGVEELLRAATEDVEELAQRDHVARPVEERGLIGLLGFYVDGLIAPDGVHDDGEVELGGDGGGEAGVAVGVPLHGGADAVAVAEVDVVAHADLVAVVEDGGAGEAEKERVEELDAAAIVVDERCEAATDADVDAHARVGGVGEVHVVALVVGDHLEGELVVIAEEEAPLTEVGDCGSLRHDVGDGEAVFLAESHVDARHQGEVEGHVALVAVAEVGTDICRPHVGFGKHEAILVFGIDYGSDLFNFDVCLGHVFAVGTVALNQVRNRVKPQGVHAHVQPEPHGSEDFFHDARIVEVEVGLMGEEPMPVVLLGNFVPGPVGFFGIGEDDANAFKDLVGIAPYVHVALGRAFRGKASSFEPGVLVAGVIDDELDHDLHAALVGGVEDSLEIVQGAVAGIDVDVVGDVVAVVSQRRGEEGEHPEAGDAEVLQVVEFGEQAGKVADAVGVGVHEGADVELVDDRVFVPEWVGGAARFLHSFSSGLLVSGSVTAGLSVVSPFDGRIKRKMCAGMVSGRSAT